MKLWWFWTVAKFWWFWSFAVIIAAVVLWVFFAGLVSGYVSTSNLLPWCGILLVVAAIVGGSVWLRLADHPNFAALTVLIPLVPLVLCVAGSLLFGAFYFLLFFFGHGRMN
jgi:hypothetical protein